MNLPTKITFSRIIAIVVMMVFLFVMYLINPSVGVVNETYFNVNWVFFGLFIFFVLASYTDHLDGKLARKNNQITTLGKFLDPVADKLLINSLVIFLACVNVSAPYAKGQIAISVWSAVILVARDIIVDAIRFIAAQKGETIAANIFGKIKTVLEMIMIGLILLNGWPFALFDSNWPNFVRICKIFEYLAVIMSVVSGFIYVYRGRKFLKEAK